MKSAIVFLSLIWFTRIRGIAINNPARPLDLPGNNRPLFEPGQDSNFTEYGIPEPVIADCPDRYAASLRRTVDAARRILLKAMDELRMRIITHDNEKRRNASFKTYEYLQFLNERLFEVWRLEDLTGLKPHKEATQSPHLACVTPQSARKYAWLDMGIDPWVRCRAIPHLRTFVAPLTSYIFICPAFFSIPPRGIIGHCPSVTNNRFVGSEKEFYLDSQVYQLIGQLYTMYVQARGPISQPHDWNECILDLSARESVMSPHNVALWTFCKPSGDD
ncbi:MAG: hypothetical protein L6R40_005371 [Gallowayella cf. fulva]|nr:MAG: hypothetical protein L6R40_005371 [Xanthomendoza cf. fulva]